MKLWSAGEVDGDVSDAYREARKWTESTINELLASRNYGDGIDEWALIYIITEERSDARPEIAKFARGKRSVEFRLRVDHARFAAGIALEQKRLLLEALARSVRLMPSLGVERVDTDRLAADIDLLIEILDSR